MWSIRWRIAAIFFEDSEVSRVLLPHLNSPRHMSNRVVYVLLSLHYAVTTEGSFESMEIHGVWRAKRKRENRVNAKIFWLWLVSVLHFDVLATFGNFVSNLLKEGYDGWSWPKNYSEGVIDMMENQWLMQSIKCNIRNRFIFGGIGSDNSNRKKMKSDRQKSDSPWSNCRCMLSISALFPLTL